MRHYNEPPYVYLAYALITKRVKIGVSNNPFKRMRSLATACGQGIELIDMIAGDRKVEKETHNLFSANRLMGEWFEDTEEIRNWFKTHKHNRLVSELDFKTNETKRPKICGPQAQPLSSIEYVQDCVKYCSVRQVVEATDLSESDVACVMRGGPNIPLLSIHLLLKFLSKIVTPPYKYAEASWTPDRFIIPTAPE